MKIIEVINYDNEKFLTKWRSEGSPYLEQIGENGENFAEWIQSLDAKIKKYANWIIIRYLKNDIKRLEDIPARIVPALIKYRSLQNKKKLQPEHQDINRITNIEDVMDLYQDSGGSRRQEAKSQEQELYQSGDARLIFNDSEYKIVIPVTHEASCFFGKNTRWCTTSQNDPKYHDEYTQDGPLYIILHKPTNTRWQFHFPSGQYMDERDEDIDVVDFFQSHPKIFNVFKRLGLVDYDKKDEVWRIESGYYNNQGQLHRLDGPAYIGADGRREWWQNGRLHRLDGPAVEWEDGSQEWWQNGQRHRLDGPAREWANGSREWYQNGLRHRLDGPAHEWANGAREWWIDGKKYSQSEWQERVDKMNPTNESIERIRQLAGLK